MSLYPYSQLDGNQILQGAYDEANQLIRTSANIIIAPTVNVTQGTTPWVVSGTVSATQSGTWNINNITGTISLPTNAAQESGGHLASIDTKLPNGLTVTSNRLLVDGSGVVQPISGTVAATQSGTWSVGRTWTLNSGTDSVSAVQSGTWNINNISGTISLPTGAATSANQTNGNQKTQVTAIPTDSLPVTQNITVQDTGSTITPFANGQNFITGIATANSTASFALSTFDAVEIQVTGTWTGTLQTEVSMDGGTTWFTRGIKQSGSPYISSSFTANFEGGMNFAGMTNARVRATAAVTGTATVRVTATVNPGSVTVSNPLTLRDSTTQTISNTIKAASTAAVATDTSLVVAISPNTSLPGFVSATSSVTSVSSSATNVTLLSSNTSRKFASFYNDSTQNCFVKLGTTASSTSYTIQMVPASFLILNNDPIYTGEIDAIWASANGAMRITELT